MLTNPLTSKEKRNFILTIAIVFFGWIIYQLYFSIVYKFLIAEYALLILLVVLNFKGIRILLCSLWLFLVYQILISTFNSSRSSFSVEFILKPFLCPFDFLSETLIYAIIHLLFFMIMLFYSIGWRINRGDLQNNQSDTLIDR